MKILTTLLTISIFTALGFSEDKKEIQKIEISAAGNPPGTMKFTKSEFKAKVGKIELNFKNPDVLQHNILILKPGTKDKVGAMADAMLTDPEALKKHYVPDSKDIISCLLYTSPSPRDLSTSRMPSSA